MRQVSILQYVVTHALATFKGYGSSDTIVAFKNTSRPDDTSYINIKHLVRNIPQIIKKSEISLKILF